MNGKKTLQQENQVGGLPDDTGSKPLGEQNKDLKLKVENDRLQLEHEAYEAGFKTAGEYQEALRQLFILQESTNLLKDQNEETRLRIAEQQGYSDIREKGLDRATREAEKTIRFAEILKPLGEDRTQIVELLKEIRDKVTELVEMPEAFREFNKYGVEKEHDKLFVEIKVLIQTWLDTVRACKESMVK